MARLVPRQPTFAPESTTSRKRRVSVPISAVTSGFATRLWYQSGWVGSPALEAKTAARPSPRSWYIIGLTRSLPLRAPTVWSRRRGAPVKFPPTLPPLARNSSMVWRFQSFTWSMGELIAGLLSIWARCRSGLVMDGSLDDDLTVMGEGKAFEASYLPRTI